MPGILWTAIGIQILVSSLLVYRFWSAVKVFLQHDTGKSHAGKFYQIRNVLHNISKVLRDLGKPRRRNVGNLEEQAINLHP